MSDFGSSADPEDSSSHHEETSSFQSAPFFADAMLDLDTAHEFPETPDASQFQRKTVSTMAKPPEALALPNVATAAAEPPPPAPPRRRNNNNNSNNATSHVISDTTTTTNTTMMSSSPSSSSPDNNEKQEMTRITHLDATNDNFNNPNNFNNDNHNSRSSRSSLHRMRLLWSSLPKSRPIWPRDWPWAAAFVVIVPIAYGGPLWFAQPHQNVWTSRPLSSATLSAWWVSAAAAAVVTQWMYGRRRRRQGADATLSEDRSTRHARIAAGLVSFAAWSVVVYLVLAVTIFVRLPAARWTTLLPVAYTVRDVYLVRRWKQRRGLMTLTRQGGTAAVMTTASPSSSSSYASRYAFFQALVAMALDILAQALRRASFLRVLTLILLTQTLFIGLWRRALINALDDESTWLLILAALGGKWATGTMARLLSLIASGGVVNWFVQQQEMYPQDEGRGGVRGELGDAGDVELVTTLEDHSSQVPEAYRTVGASVYQSVLRMDDVEDDDEDDEEEEEVFRPEGQYSSGFPSSSMNSSSSHHHHHHSPPQESLTTVRGLLSAGLSVSFGSVAMCGLLGGPAQFVWSQIRKFDLMQQQQQQHAVGGSLASQTLWEKVWNRVVLLARSFVRNHSDLAMSHVAAYYKPYPRAARDVARLIEEAGVEPVLHDDITTHMCSCVGGTISGAIVLVTGHFAQRHRVANNYDDEATDLDVVKNMLLAFILSYTLLFTVMEPLRAAIKAVYVAFAQNPRSLSHAYPLIYHRLTRLSEANLS